jgi:hypothetical protein
MQAQPLTGTTAAPPWCWLQQLQPQLTRALPGGRPRHLRNNIGAASDGRLSAAWQAAARSRQAAVLCSSSASDGQLVYDVSQLDAAPRLAAAAAAAIAATADASNGGGAGKAAARPASSRQQQQGLKRPAVPTGPALRELLQEQIACSSSWQQLATLLNARQQHLTLKHLASMVAQV